MKKIIPLSCLGLALLTTGCVVAPAPGYYGGPPRAYYSGYEAYPVYYGGYYHRSHGYYNGYNGYYQGRGRW